MTTLTFDTYISATPEQVWGALTDPATVPRWRFGMHFHTDWAPGSPLTSTSPDGHGTVLHSEPARRLSYQWIARENPEANGNHPSAVTFELTPAGAVTRLTTTHDGLEPDGEFTHIVAAGWPMILSSLKSLLETGTPLTFPATS